MKDYTMLGPVEFCEKIRDILGDWHTMSFYSAEQFQKDVEAAKMRLRVITVGEVYRAIGDGFPKGGTCHIGSYDTEIADARKGPTARVVEDVGHTGLQVAYIFHFDDGTWVEEISASVEVFGEDISECLASEYVPLLGEPFATCYRKMMEAGR